VADNHLLVDAIPDFDDGESQNPRGSSTSIEDHDMGQLPDELNDDSSAGTGSQRFATRQIY